MLELCITKTIKFSTWTLNHMYEEWRFTQTGNILDTQKRIFDGSTFDNLFLKKLHMKLYSYV